MPRGNEAPKSQDDEEADEKQRMKDEALGDDDVVDVDVDVEAERKATKTDEILDRLDRELVGLVPVKTRIREIADLLVVDRLRRRFGIDSSRPTLHMSFTGSPGTGKTTVAIRMAELLKSLGTSARATSRRSPATTWWVSTSATPRRRPRRS